LRKLESDWNWNLSHTLRLNTAQQFQNGIYGKNSPYVLEKLWITFN